MRLNFNTKPEEFLDMLRDMAIKNKLPPQFIDCVDNLYELGSKEADLEKLGDELFDMKAQRDDLLDELRALHKAVEQNLDPDKSPAIERALKIAGAAITRHET
jgi:hypothetical protein